MSKNFCCLRFRSYPRQNRYVFIICPTCRQPSIHMQRIFTVISPSIPIIPFFSRLRLGIIQSVPTAEIFGIISIYPRITRRRQIGYSVRNICIVNKIFKISESHAENYRRPNHCDCASKRRQPKAQTKSHPKSSAGQRSFSDSRPNISAVFSCSYTSGDTPCQSKSPYSYQQYSQKQLSIRVYIHHGIIPAISIQIQTVDGVRRKIG